MVVVLMLIFFAYRLPPGKHHSVSCSPYHPYYHDCANIAIRGGPILTTSDDKDGGIGGGGGDNTRKVIKIYL